MSDLKRVNIEKNGVEMCSKVQKSIHLTRKQDMEIKRIARDLALSYSAVVRFCIDKVCKMETIGEYFNGLEKDKK